MIPLRILFPSPWNFFVYAVANLTNSGEGQPTRDGRVANIAALGTGHLPRRRELQPAFCPGILVATGAK
jgi:hypothetical protein